jgi:aminopeptidase-like protein/spore coat polysaccharide biosynthesis protein SpsF (cytidylyltransferase family)
VQDWVVATSEESDSDPIVNICSRLGFEVYRGSETDVLARFIACIETHEPQYIVRVCADNPFVCPEVIDDLIGQLTVGDEYIANHRPHQFCRIADGFGVEIARAASLLEVAQNSTDASVREHVTTKLVSSHPRRQIRVDELLRFPYLRFDIDTSEDLARLNAFVNASSIGVATPATSIVRKYIANEIQELLEHLFPLNRSLMGPSNRLTLDALEEIVPLDRKSVATGTQIFDWSVPEEWTVSEAWIANLAGVRVVDLKNNYLHVVAHSNPVDNHFSLRELESHLHSHELSGAIPYRTTYYKRDWGFCVTREQLELIRREEGPFHVVIKAKFQTGSMDFAEHVVIGRSEKVILISTYFCHPNLANDSLSGVILTALLARHLSSLPNPRYTYRLVFVPETIGAIAYLHQLGNEVKQVECGLQITTVGGPGRFCVKSSWDANHPINQIVRSALEESGAQFAVVPFDIHGSDERQYSSPGFRINMATISKDMYYQYPEYHTSLDNLDFVNGVYIQESLEVYLKVIELLESRRVYSRTNPFGEPMLSKHDLYDSIGGGSLPGQTSDRRDLMLWILFLSDGHQSTVDIARQLGVDESTICGLSELLALRGLLEEK